MEENLNPCSTCGRDEWEVWVEYSADNKNKYYIQCGHCYAHTRVYDTRILAIRAWNESEVYWEIDQCLRPARFMVALDLASTPC